MYEKLKLWYEHGAYTAEMVQLFVTKGIITEEQYRSICEKNEED